LLFRDVTQAVRAKKMRVDFVANASHELRSPLAALLGFVATIKESAADVPDAQKQFLDIMERGVHRMRRLIDDLLSRSRVEANEHVRPRGMIDITIALRVSIETLQVRAVERDMEIAIDFADGLPEVIGNPDQQTQVSHSLTENTIKYGVPSTNVEISVEPVERIPECGHSGVVVRVNDFGEGIDKEMIRGVSSGRGEKLTLLGKSF